MMIKETKHERIFIPSGFDRKSDNPYLNLVNRALEEYEVHGWKAERDDIFKRENKLDPQPYSPEWAIYCSTHGQWYRVTYTRFVEGY